MACRGSKLSEGGSSSGGSPATPPDRGLDLEAGWGPLDQLAVLKQRVSETEGQMDEGSETFLSLTFLNTKVNISRY